MADMTREEAMERIKRIKGVFTDYYAIDDKSLDEDCEVLDFAIADMKAIKALGEDMRICQKSITDEKTLIGFNMAVAICNKYFAESEDK